MDRSQAKAVAEAMLQPDDARNRLQAERQLQNAHDRRRRVSAAVSLAGMALGMAAASQLPIAWSQGMLVGGALGFLLAEGWQQWTSRR